MSRIPDPRSEDEALRQITARAFRPKPAAPSKPATDYSPADEYDRQLEERRIEAIAKIKSFAAWWLALHPLALILLCGGLADVRENPAALIGAGCLWVLFLLPAVGAAVTALRERAVLPLPWFALGLAPWLLILAELAPLMLLLADWLS